MTQKSEILGLNSCQYDPDVCKRPSVQDYVMEYYEYILVNVDNILYVSMNALKVLQETFNLS